MTQVAPQTWDVIVVGAGAAGLFAASRAATEGARVLVLEKNRKIGVKILISGGTRCNLTHDCSFREVAKAFGNANQFLLSALGRLTPQMVVDLIETLGVATYVESITGKVFPVSDRALDVRDALYRRALESGAEFQTSAALQSVDYSEGLFHCVSKVGSLAAKRLILTCGGLSYSGCGTTGDGYAWAANWGHQIVPTHPALTPLVSPADWVKELSGIAIEDTIVSAVDHAGKSLGQSRTATLFTHFGLSGPGPMNISHWVSQPVQPPATAVVIDLLPSMARQELISEWRNYAHSHGKQSLTSLPTFGLPARLFEQAITAGRLSPQRRLAETSREELERFANQLKGMNVPISGTRGFEKAEVTAGGIELSEVNSRTMESRLVPGLYFAGEILDINGPIGGYNFQAAFSTGDLAGACAARSIN